MSTQSLFIGLMSGTSIDAVDAVLVDFGTNVPTVLAQHETEVPKALRNSIIELTQPGNDSVDKLGHCDIAIGEIFAQSALELLTLNGFETQQITAIGSHGQTVRHRPPQHGIQHPFSMQIGDPNIIAARTGITTVADFRRRDVALGGQGAPLAPAFHNAVFRSAAADRAILNLGGIANVTWLPANGAAIGFDTGPANVLMDSWCQRHTGKPYDKNGSWASSGNVHAELLRLLLGHPFLSLPFPKSTGREDFNIAWLDDVLARLPEQIADCDVQATLLEYTVQTAAEAVKALPKSSREAATELYLCGGGALNGALVSRIAALTHPAKVATTSTLGLDPKLVEGAAFAWLAKRTLEKLPGNLPGVTGSAQDALLGGVYFA